MNEVINNSIWLRCLTCDRDTGHKVCSEYVKIAIPEEDQPIAKNGQWQLYAWTMSQILECRGCGRQCFRHGWTLTPQSECTWVWTIYNDPEERGPLPAVSYLPAKVDKLWSETSVAFHSGAFTLAAAGMRGVVEGVCQDRNHQGATLQQKIKKLNGVLSTGDIHLLNVFRALGNQAIHEMRTPGKIELAAALDILEHILRTLYYLPGRAVVLKSLRAERLSDRTLSLAKAG